MVSGIFVARVFNPWAGCVEAELVFGVESPASMLGIVGAAQFSSQATSSTGYKPVSQ